MFSNQPRKIYRRNQLIEVICQLRFPEILKIEAHEPADFQDAIRQVYPQFHMSEFYSDSRSDTPLAQVADRAFLVKGDELLPW